MTTGAESEDYGKLPGSFTVFPDPSGGYIRVTVTGGMTSELGVACGREMLRAGEQKGILRFLLDLRKSVNIQSVTENYRFAYQDLEKVGFRSARTAMLTDPRDHSHDFIETVCRNAGYHTRLFTEEGEAVAWLKGS